MSTPILEKTFHRRSGILDARHHSLSTNSVFAVCAALVMVLLSYGNSLAEVTAKPRTNLTVIRDLAEVIGRRIGDSPGAAGIDTLSVSVEPRETAWYIESALIRGIAGSSRSVRLSKKGAVTAECAIGEIAVDYSDARADGLLGKTIVDRHVSVTISALVVLNASGEIFLNEDLYEGRTDTIEL